MKRFFENYFVRTIGGALLILALLLLGLNLILALVTKHGTVIEVPDMTGLSVYEARSLAQNIGVRVDVVDSVYIRKKAKGVVYSQNPVGGSRVKKGRRVLLVTNAVCVQQVAMPNLVGYSMRQAKAEISLRGLVLGRLVYVSDMATNNVLRQLCAGRDVAPGTMVESGSVVDIVLGLNANDNRTLVPDVRGMKYHTAVDAVQDNSLNVGRLVFDASVKNYADSLNAVVYRQYPDNSENTVLMGDAVTLYLSVNHDRLK